MTRTLPLALFVGFATFFARPARAADQQATDQPRVIVRVAPLEQATNRPSPLIPMYVGLAGLEAYDGISTYRGTHDGARELNPLVGGLVGQPAALWTLKAVSTASTIYFAEQLWRNHHPIKAIVTVAVANGAMAVIAAHNASVLASSR